MTEQHAEVGTRVGWQADGSYIACAECGYTPSPDPELPAFITTVDVLPRTPGTATHRGDCPTVALPRDVQERLQDQLTEMARLRRRAEAEARFYVIG